MARLGMVASGRAGLARRSAASVVTRCEDERHAIVNFGDQLVSVRCRLLGSLLSLDYQLG
jgi:hypothetical protein